MASKRSSFPFAEPRRRALGLALGSLGAGLWPAAAGAFAAPAADSLALRYRLLHSFGDPAVSRDAAEPRAELIEASDGLLYGTTYGGGRHGQGTVFRAERRPSGTLRVRALHDFDDIEGSLPWAPLMQASDGNLYGTSSGSSRPQTQRGSIFRIAPDGTFTHMFTFGGLSGKSPRAGLIQASDGHLYGTTADGGAFLYWGVAFRITLAGEATKLHDFDGAQTGGAPSSELLESSDGFLYGSAAFGGQPDLRGLIFRLSLAGDYSIAHPFTFPEGEAPASLIEVADGTKFGVTNNGGLGSISGGTAYRLETDGSFHRLYRFRASSPIGQNPGGGALLALDEGGMIGTTLIGGALGGGTVFRLIGRKAQALHSFDATYAAVKSGLLRASDGRLYGTTSSGGAFGRGTIYSLELRAAR